MVSYGNLSGEKVRQMREVDRQLATRGLRPYDFVKAVFNFDPTIGFSSLYQVCM